MTDAVPVRVRRLVPGLVFVVAAVVLVPAPAQAAGTYVDGCRRTEVIAHRGEHRVATENTIRAFRAAARRGADAIETDLRATRDDRVVLMHDRNLRRTTRSRGKVRRMTGRQVHRVRTDDGQRVPYVTQAARFLRNHRQVEGVFQLKSMTNRSLRRLRAALVDTRTLGRVTLTATRRGMLRRARHVMPHVRRVRISWQPVSPSRVRRYAGGVVMPLRRLSASRVERLRSHGLSVGAMNVDSPREWRQLARIRVRKLSTNRVPRYRRYCRGILL